MTRKRVVEEFLAQRRLAVVGVSRNGGGFGYAAWRALREKGYDAVPVNPAVSTIDGTPCYPSLRDVPGPVGGALVTVAPSAAPQVVEDAAAAGIPRVWLQQGASSQAALDRCRERGIDVVANECILMFADPRGIHKFHRTLWGWIGKLPQ